MLIEIVVSPKTPTCCSGPGALNGFGEALRTYEAGTLALITRGLTKVVGSARHVAQ
jgi:hypothetical protein